MNGNLHFVKKELRKNLPLAVSEVCFENNLQSIIIEGGATILNQFINTNNWDEARVFIGSKNFENGILAPQINLQPQSNQTIINNQLLHYKNNI